MNISKASFFLTISFLILLGSCNKPVDWNSEVTDDKSARNDLVLNTVFTLADVPDGGFFIAGISNSRITLIRTDVNFNPSWTRSSYEWGTLIPGNGWGTSFYSVEIKSLFADDDGNFYCFGSIMEGGDVVWTKILAVKLDRFGNELKRVIFDDGSLFQAVRTPDNEFLLFGTKMIRIKTDFSVRWEKDIWDWNYMGIRIIMNNEEGYSITGRADDNVLLRKTDQHGNYLWTMKDYNKVPFDDAGFDLIQLKDGGYMVAGRTRSIIEPWIMNAFVMRTNDEGDTIWTGKLAGRNNQWFENFLNTENDKQVILGQVGYPSDSINKSLLVKIDGSGQLTDSCTINRPELLVYDKSGYYIKAEKKSGSIRFSKVDPGALFQK